MGSHARKSLGKLPAWLHRDLKVRAVQLGIDIQDAVETGIGLWRAADVATEEVDTAGADSFSTWLPEGLYGGFRGDCAARGVSYVQGPRPGGHHVAGRQPRRRGSGRAASHAPYSPWSTRRAASARPPCRRASPRPRRGLPGKAL